MSKAGDAEIISSTAAAIASYRSGDFAGAQRHAGSVLRGGARPRDRAVCLQMLGWIALREGRLEQAVDSLAKALGHQPDVPQLRTDLARARIALGRRLRERSRFAEAEKLARAALRALPGDPDARNLLGVVLHDQDELDEARAILEAAVRAAPRHARLRLNYANVLYARDEIDTAIEEYRRALALRPDHVKTLVGAGAALLAAKRSKPALQLLERAAALDPENAQAHFNLANALVGCHRTPEAVERYEQALRLRPSWAVARASWLRERAEICDWRDDWSDENEKLLDVLSAELDAGRASPLNASQTPALPLPAELMRRIACRQTEGLRREHRRRPCAAQRRARGADPDARLRVGYLSGDFRHNAIGHLTRSMFGHHDRRRFEVFTYSYGPDDESEYRQRIRADSQHFVDLYESSDAEIAERIAADAIDILVDITGYAGNGRPGVPASRPAPVLVHYLGFPGTLGGLVDYFVTDPVSTPPGSPLREEFAEALLYLPHTYQMTDDDQPIADRIFSREDCGLPETGFVFAAFNNSYKIQPEIFDVWMRILSAVPGAVLWLVTKESRVEENLRRAAARRDVDPARLVFASVLQKPEHLARHALADLFLDTTVCCAHTTATDSLWAGLPLITRSGERFTERVAASLLSAAGLPELIARDLSEYERLAIELATRPARYRELRETWSRRRKESKLFDTEGRVRELERAYEAIWQRHRAGLPPRDLSIEAE